MATDAPNPTQGGSWQRRANGTLQRSEGPAAPAQDTPATTPPPAPAPAAPKE